jgi:cell division protein FtsQ
MSLADVAYPAELGGELPDDRRQRNRVALLLVILLLVAAWPLARDLATRPVSAVRVAGEFHHLSREALERTVARAVGQAGFLGVDVEAVRRAALSVPWVREVTVRRAWPDSLHLAVVEREAVARWNEAALLEEDGAEFAPPSLREVDDLVRLSGPQGRAVQVLDRLRELQAVVAGSAIAPVVALDLDPRGTWRLQLADGAEIVLGHGQGASVLARFAHAAGTLLELHREGFERVDLRYSNGFAVRWRAADQAGREEGAG